MSSDMGSLIQKYLYTYYTSEVFYPYCGNAQ